MNVPNTLTMFRIVFAIAVFYFCAVNNWDLCLLFFILASVTDFIDGWWARKFNQITIFGRIMDPFADKFLICGVFICLLGIPSLSQSQGPIPAWLMLQPWMVVVIVARELLVTSLRAVVEKSGGDFSAKWIGKWKMGVQCIALIACFLLLAGTVGYRSSGEIEQRSLVGECIDRFCGAGEWTKFVFIVWLVSLWGTVLITLYSGITYCINATKTIRNQSQEQ